MSWVDELPTASPVPKGCAYPRWSREAAEDRLEAILRYAEFDFERKTCKSGLREGTDFFLAKPKGASVDDFSVEVSIDPWGHTNVWFADDGMRCMYQPRGGPEALVLMLNAFCTRIGLQPRMVVE